MSGDSVRERGSGAHRLHPGVVTVWRAKAGLVSACVIAAFGPWDYIRAREVGGPPAGTFIAVLIVLAAALIAALPPAYYRNWSYTVHDAGLETERGLLVRRRRLIPYLRLQHVDLSHGPVDRRIGLQELVLHTAARGAASRLPGLAAEEAAALRRLLLDRSGLDDAA